MAYFTIPYQIHFEDTMAYESHHYLTNFRFQCAVREALYFSPGPQGNDLWREDLQNVVILTYEGYSRNLAPLRLGDRLLLFLTVGEMAHSSLQLCIRAVSENGIPIAVGYQRLLCIARDSREPVPVPRSMTQYQGHIDEPLTGPLFQELAHKGGRALDRIFTPEVVALARAGAGARDLHGRFLEGTGEQILLSPAAPPRSEDRKTVLLLPGQGSYDFTTLRELYHAFPSTRPAFAMADAISQAQVGRRFLPLVLADSAAEHDQLLAEFPDLDQYGIFLLGVLTAQLLRERGLTFELVAGHSFGEISALAAAGALDLESGLTLVGQRILALQNVGAGSGAMAALACDERRARAYLESLPRPGPAVAVVNHPKQTVVAGPLPAISALLQELPTQGVAVTLLGSRYPFHSPWLEAAVGRFAVGISGIAAQEATVAPVFSPVDGQIHRRVEPILARLPTDLIRPLRFHDALQALYDKGVRTFIQCGYGSMLSRIVNHSLAGRDAVTALHCGRKGSTLAAAMAAVIAQAEAAKKISQRPDRAEPPQSGKSDSESALPAADSPAHLDRTMLVSVGAVGETPLAEPVAIVGMGCVLPGAENVAALWHNLLAGVSGIVDLGQLDPDLRQDFHAAGDIKPDKTYSLLVGAVPALDPAVTSRLPYAPSELSALSLPEVLLGVALSEALAARQDPAAAIAAERTRYVLGATADGSIKQDLTQLMAGMDDIAAAVANLSAARRADLIAAARARLGLAAADAAPARQHEIYAAVFRRLLGAAVSGHVIDTACSSSLYAVALGMRSLAERACDVAIAGGVYEVTMGNSCLFSQFGGLSATGSHALDAGADGVVFGTGAAVLILKRLPDAIAADDRVFGVIRGVGLSSDGKSPAVNSPQHKGQILAMQRAYRAAGISPHATQLVEAHATATLVGDATELKSLNQVYAGARGIELRSLKSLIGHTGWAAGIASVIAVCKGFAEQVIPPQHDFKTPNPALCSDTSPFTVATAQKPWPRRADGLPLRAAVDGFGFGGTNAQLIVESYVPAFHRQLRAAPSSTPKVFSVVGLGCFFPAADGLLESAPPAKKSSGGLRFATQSISLPQGRRMLPDVLSAMDGSQRLALLAAQDALRPILAADPQLAGQTGIVLGLEGKTARGIAAMERVFHDRLERLFPPADSAQMREDEGEPPLPLLLSEVSRQLSARSHPTGPYTLSGAMPNVASGRVANFFNLNGPNLVVDAAADSLWQALQTAAQLLGSGESEFMLAGAVNAACGPSAARSAQGRQDKAAAVGEAVIVLAVARPETAAQYGLRPIAMLDLTPQPGASATDVSQANVDYRGATGAAELARALHAAAAAGTATVLLWPGSGASPARTLRLTAAEPRSSAQTCDSSDVTQPLAEPRPSSPRRASDAAGDAAGGAASDAASDAAGEPASVPASVPSTPQPGRYAPVLVERPAAAQRHPGGRESRRILFVCDKPRQLAQAGQEVLAGLNYRVACPRDPSPADRVEPQGQEPQTIKPPASRFEPIEIDTATEEALQRSLQNLRSFEFDAIVAVKFLVDAKDDDLLEHGWDSSFLRLLFAVSRYAYDDLGAGKVSLSLLMVGGVKPSGLLDPQTGLLSGYLKSLARELPQADIHIVQTDQPELAAALAEAATELAHGSGPLIEVCFRRGRRYEVRLAEQAVPAAAPLPVLGPNSVVIMTGGARGVTAVLAEALLERFGCRVVLLGRSAPEQVAPHLLAMSDAEFAAYEVDYLTRMQAAQPHTRLGEARQRYQAILAAREAHLNLLQLKSLPGLAEYHAVDVTNRAAVAELIKSVVARLGPVQLVVHGAGVQYSKRLPKRKLGELQQTIDTKLLGLHNLYAALRRYVPAGHPIHYHLLTSAFSVLGNDGQPDYGAANEAMNRLATAMSARRAGDTWSALGWLGWERIGMTRGSEYAVLKEERGLYGITAKEGKEIFLATLSAAPPPAVTVLLGEGERSFYKVEAAAPPAAERRSEAAGLHKEQWKLSLDSHPYLAAHRVRGKPMLPGTFELELAARTAQSHFPALHLLGFQRCRFTRFVPLRKGQDTLLRCESEVIEKVPSCTRLKLRLLSDIVHPSGIVLQEGIVHLECEALLSRAAPGPLRRRIDAQAALTGIAVADPYTDPRAAVFHQAPFDTLRQAVHGADQNRSLYRPPDDEQLAQLTGCMTPFLLNDAAFKVAQLMVLPDGSMPVCVIAEIESLYFIPGLTDEALAAMTGDIVLASRLPQVSGELLRVEHVEACNAQGTVLAVADGLVARPIGQIPMQRDAFAH